MTNHKEIPTVSVVIPSYNAEATLGETLRSIIDQLGPADEVLVVDDGSIDRTKEVIGRLEEKRVRYLYQSNSGGPASPRNRGISEANGDLVLLFDSDDLMMPGKIEAAKQAFIENRDVGLMFSNFMTIDDSGNILNPRFLDDYEFTRHYADQNEAVRFAAPEACRGLARENFVGTSGVAIPRSVLQDVGGFDETLTNGDDRDMWFRLTRRYPTVYLPTVHHCYRISENSISTGSAHKRTPSKLKVLERQLIDPLDQAFARDIRALIADNFHALAYESFVQGDMKQCRSEIVKGWKASHRIIWIKLWVYSLLGRRLSSAIRRLKRATRG